MASLICIAVAAAESWRKSDSVIKRLLLKSCLNRFKLIIIHSRDMLQDGKSLLFFCMRYLTRRSGAREWVKTAFLFLGSTSDYNSMYERVCVWRAQKEHIKWPMHAVHERRDQRAFSSGAVYWATTKKNIKWRI